MYYCHHFQERTRKKVCYWFPPKLLCVSVTQDDLFFKVSDIMQNPQRSTWLDLSIWGVWKRRKCLHCRILGLISPHHGHGNLFLHRRRGSFSVQPMENWCSIAIFIGCWVCREIEQVFCYLSGYRRYTLSRPGASGERNPPGFDTDGESLDFSGTRWGTSEFPKHQCLLMTIGYETQTPVVALLILLLCLSFKQLFGMRLFLNVPWFLPSTYIVYFEQCWES